MMMDRCRPMEGAQEENWTRQVKMSGKVANSHEDELEKRKRDIVKHSTSCEAATGGAQLH